MVTTAIIYTGCARSNRGSLKFNKKGNNSQYENK